ncbi:MAG TPA: DNA polymerase III subunit chi [Gammaproteobacteria bacterium]
MTRVDFYILRDDSDTARLVLACRIAEKAMQQDQHVFIHSSSEAEARKLDELLWTFSQGSFVPHKIVGPDGGAPALEPVLIGAGIDPAGPRFDVMINLADEVPEFFSRYERVVEPVDGNPARRQRSRERYRFYRDRGYPLATHEVGGAP